MKLYPVSPRTGTMKSSLDRTLNRWSDLCWSSRRCAWKRSWVGLGVTVCSPLGGAAQLAGVDQCGEHVRARERWLRPAPQSLAQELCAFADTIKHPSFVSGLPRLPVPTRSVSKLSTCQVAPPSRVYLRWSCVSKPQTLERPLRLGPVPTLGRVLLSNGQVLTCPRRHLCDRAVAEGQGLRQTTTHSRFQVSSYSDVQYQQMWLLSGV